MKINRSLIILCAFISSLILFGSCSSVDQSESMIQRHEAEIEGVPRCLNCHETDTSETIMYERYNHSKFFIKNHKSPARRNPEICALCHRESSCNDCHATQIELKPSIKHQTKTYSPMMHRGDYLTRHKLDARINPAPCFRCHGSPKASRTCVRCHG
jgi:hypothetical protein